MPEPSKSHGWIDLHSHLIPGIDDGCQTLAESLTCVAELQKQGFVGTVCTPHFWPTHFPNNIPEKVEQGVARLRAEFADLGIDYQLWSGGEVRIAEDTIRWLQRVGVPTLGESRCVLIDYWGDDWPKYAQKLIDWLFSQEYQPILAHPERMGVSGPEYDQMIESLLSQGVWLQCNFNSLGGGEGPWAKHRVEQLLQHNQLEVMALDMHAPRGLPGRFRGLEVLQAEHGLDTCKQLLEAAPRKVLSHQAQTPVS